MVRIERHRLQDRALDRLEKLRIWMRSEGFGGELFRLLANAGSQYVAVITEDGVVLREFPMSRRVWAQPPLWTSRYTDRYVYSAQ